MDIKTIGVVIKQRNIGENDRIITILSKELGIIEATAKGVKSIKSKLRSGCQLLCYSEFDLFKNKNNYRVISAQVVNSFYNLRLDVEKFALAGYFSEITYQISPSLETTAEFMSLLLNSLHLLDTNKKSNILIKSVFEFKSVSIAGFMPNLICCKYCFEYQKEQMMFLPIAGELICSECQKIYDNKENRIQKINISVSVLTAMRHIIYSQPNKIFSFELDEKGFNHLNFITQNYLLINAQSKFPSLNVYNDLLKGE